jgi:hypothetical protein
VASPSRDQARRSSSSPGSGRHLRPNAGTVEPSCGPRCERRACVTPGRVGPAGETPPLTGAILDRVRRPCGPVSRLREGPTSIAVRLSPGRSGSRLGGRIGLLERYPRMRGIVFDLPETVRDEHALGDRVRRRQLLRVGAARRRPSARDDPPRLGRPLGTADPSPILEAVRAAAGGRLVVLDSVIEPGNAPDGAKWLDLLMLVIAGGPRIHGGAVAGAARRQLTADARRPRRDRGSAAVAPDVARAPFRSKQKRPSSATASVFLLGARRASPGRHC